MNVIWMGFSASLVAGLFSGIGALGVFFVSKLSTRLEDVLLSFAAGVIFFADSACHRLRRDRIR